MDILEIEKKLEVVKEDFIQLFPNEFQDRIRKSAYLCGGCIYSLRKGEEPHDYDFFLKDKQLANELLDYFKLQNVKQFKNLLQGKYNGLNLTISKYAITLGKYQIITKYIGEPREVVEEFDFKHNMFYYDNNHIESLVDWDFLDTNKLYFNEGRARDICGTILRIVKFSKRGMIVSKAEIAKMLKKLEENGFDESEKEILKNYTAY